MINSILTVGGITLVSRVTGFLRDILLAAVLGAGPVADAFFVALRLPNHFRAIFAEGAFNAAFVPAYARIRGESGDRAVRLFADRIFMLLFVIQLILLAIALLFTDWVIDVLAPGFSKDPGRFTLAVELTRITFPYLLLISLVTLYGGILNALDRFAAAAAAPILLNLSLMMALALAAFFPTAGHAAAWGVLLAGILEFVLVAGAAARQGVMLRFCWPRFDADVRSFPRFGPATIGRLRRRSRLCRHYHREFAGDRCAVGAVLCGPDNQLPIGGLASRQDCAATGNARRIAAGDEAGVAMRKIAIELTALSVPCLVAFRWFRTDHARTAHPRAFTADAHAAAITLTAYAIGLLPFVPMRSASVTFLARAIR
jgi:putative peptidoglycan lipid II flippase